RSAVLADLAGKRYSTYSTFTTAAAADASAPQLLLRSVADGATGVPVNGRLVFQFDTALADRCVNTQTVRVSANGTPVAGTVALSTDRTLLTFTPQSPLSVSTAYSVTLDGLCDLVGNTLSGVTSGFTTSSIATADTTGPTVTIVPANAATGVSPNTTITVTFNEAIDVTTLAGGFQLTVSGLSGEVAGDLAVNGNVVTFTPAAPLPGNKLIYATVNGVKDLVGNNNSYRSNSFTTGVATDAAAPQVVSITPNDKAVDIGTNTPIVLTFSESLNPTTVNNTTFALFVNGNTVQPSVSRSQDNRTVTLTAGLPPASVVAVIVTGGVQDLTGNALADYASVFTTSAATDTGRPSVVSQFPGSGASNVLPDASLVLYVNEAMNEATLAPALHVAQNGQLVGGTITLNANGQAIVFKPQQPWAANALIEVYLDNNARDVGGNALNNYQGSFRVAPDPRVTVPSVVATQPSYGSTVAPVNAALDLQYSEALDPATVNAATVTFRDYNSGQALAVTVSLTKGDRVIHIVPQAPLAVNHAYYVQSVAGIKDLDGQAAAAYFFYFTTNATATADTVAPKVLAMSPP
ncbi:MAG: Ig-like domain-containing protein, partial [Actinomycetota bacterium]